jgi:2-polyprenyl-3-methyl-5-hydroxy-6-metoxy-1,4-benzoquinol methylase
MCGGGDFSEILRQEYKEGVLIVSRCRDCTISFSSTRLSDEYLETEYYESDFEGEFAGYDDYEHVSERFFAGIVEKVKSARPGGRWLDVGCGRGYLVQAAAKNGFSGCGIDLSTEFADDPSVDLRRADLFDPQFEAETFDIISVINVLDHIGDPRRFLTRTIELLTPGGLLFIHVPNERYFDKRPFRGQSTYIPNVHIVNYSQDNVADLLSRVGFSSCKIMAPRFKGSSSWRRMSLLRGLEAFNKVAGVFGMGLWPTIQVLARK